MAALGTLRICPVTTSGILLIPTTGSDVEVFWTSSRLRMGEWIAA